MHIRHVYVLLVGLLLAGSLSPAVLPSAVAQDASADTSLWVRDVTGKLAGSQAAYRNWQEGGLNSVALTASINGRAEKQGTRWGQTHELRLAFGFIDQEGEEFRKSDDLIRLQSNLRYTGNGFFRIFKPTIAANGRTQFAKGFDFSGNPFPDDAPQAGQEAPVQTSEFLAPAFFTESLGLTYEPTAWLSLRLGAASKQTVVLVQDLRVLYDVDIDQATRIEAGSEFAAGFNRELAENVRLTSNFNAFYSLNETGSLPDFIWENVLSMKVNSWLSTELEFVALYDQNTTDAVQLREVLSVGVSFVLI